MALTAHLKIDNKEYLLLECWYEFVRPMIGNRVCGRVPDETYIHFTIATNNDDPLLYEWMANPMLRYDGSILFLRDTDDFPFKTLYFENAFCINLHDSFSKQSNAQMTTTVTILASKVSFDEKEKDDVPLARGSYEERTAYSYEETETSTKNAGFANVNTLETKAPVKPNIQIKGGAYKNLTFDNTVVSGKKKETIEQRHHMPSQYCGNKGKDGGTITMKTSEHKDTASYDSRQGAGEYRKRQKELVDSGKFEEAFEMDVQDIKNKFGSKYNEAIEHLREWYKNNGKF